MDDALIERAVEAGAKVSYERRAELSLGPSLPWESQSQQVHDLWRASLRRSVTAALAEVEADIRAGALRDLADHMESEEWGHKDDWGVEVIYSTALRVRADNIESEGKA